jgi:hypothetical protein
MRVMLFTASFGLIAREICRVTVVSGNSSTKPLKLSFPVMVCSSLRGS